MSLDAGKLDEEKKQKKRKELEKKRELENVAESQKKREKLTKVEQANEELSHLKDAIEHGQVDKKSLKKVEKIAEDNQIDSKELKEIMEMIEDLHKNKARNKYIPEELRITKEEYKSALQDETQREKTLLKLDAALGILIQHISPTANRGINLIGSLSLILDKNLITVQENHIDIKRSLQNKEKKTSSFWKDFLKIFG